MMLTSIGWESVKEDFSGAERDFIYSCSEGDFGNGRSVVAGNAGGVYVISATASSCVSYKLASPLSRGTGIGHGMLILSRGSPVHVGSRGVVLTANLCQSHLRNMGFHLGLLVDSRVANTGSGSGSGFPLGTGNSW